MRHSKRMLWLVCIMFLASAFIAWHVPYTHDDWDWGRPPGIANWLSGVFNNRYAGSFFIVILTRSHLLKTLVMALAMTALPLVCAKLALGGDSTGDRREALCILTCFVSLSMPVITWRQTYGWVSGFANFTLGALFLLSLLALLQHVYHHKPSPSARSCLGVFLLSVAAQLFSENISAFLPLFLVFSIAVTKCWREKQTFRFFLSALLGTLLGAVVMFSNPMFPELAETGVAVQQFRTLTFSPGDPIPTILWTLVSIFLTDTLPALYETQPMVVLLFGAAAWVLHAPSSRRRALLFSVPMLVYGAGCLYCAWMMRQVYGWLPASAALRTLGAVLFTALMLLSILSAPGNGKWRSLAFVLFSLLLATPFAVISYTGPRCYHISHFCLLVGAGASIAQASVSLPVRRVLAVCLAVILACRVQAYVAIGASNRLRQELTEQALQSQADTLVLPTVDARYTYSWGYNPQGAARAEHYRQFHHLPEDLTLVFLPYGTVELWPDIPAELAEQAEVYP